MRILAYLLLLYSVFNFGDGIYDQTQGVTRDRRGAITEQVYKRTEPERFWNLISYRFTRGAIFLAAGVVMLGMAKRFDASDPTSPDFAANVKDAPIDPMLEKELQKRRGGLR